MKAKILQTGIKEHKGFQANYQVLADYSLNEENIRIVCKEIGMDAFYAKEDMDFGINEGIPFFIDCFLKEDVFDEKIITIQGREYKITIHRGGKKADGKIWARIVCKGAKYNQEHPEEQVENVINEVIPSILKKEQESKKTAAFQIRFTQSQKEKLSLLAQKEGVSISDFIIQKVFA